MQVKQWFVAAIAASALLISAVSSSTAAPSTNQAFQIDVKLKASYEDPGTGKLGKTTITSSTIINLAQGLDITTPVPTNIVLAILIDCDANQGLLAVVDISNNNALVRVVGQLDVDGSIPSSGKGVGSMYVHDLASGNENNGIFDGWLAFGAKVEMMDPEANLCPLAGFKSTSASGIVQGLNALVPGGQFKVTITGGSMKTVKPIGYVAPIL